MKKIAIFAFTKQAINTGLKLVHQIDADIFIPERNWTLFNQCSKIEGNFHKFFDSMWNKYDYFIMIMSTGIVVRSIAHLLKHKSVDPAVIVIDQKGEFVIPLVSGHLGGGNEFAVKVAKKLIATPVLTTASDVQGYPAFDDIARKNNCNIEHLSKLKDIAALILDNEDIGLYTTVPLKLNLPPNIHVATKDNYETLKSYKGLITITEQVIPDELKTIPHFDVRPKNIIVGIGCRRGKSKTEILTALKKHFDEHNISLKSISKLTTVDIKKDEIGLIQLAEQLNCPLIAYPTDKLKDTIKKYDINESEFVKKTIGIGAVCEPSALLTANEPLLISHKSCYDGITIAVVKDISVSINE